MTVKKKLQMSAILSIGFAIAVGLFLYWTMSKVNQEIQKDLLAHDLVRGLAELNIVTYEYLLHQEEWAITQWQSKYDSLRELVRAIQIEGREEKVLTAAIRSHFENIRNIFVQLTSNYEKMGSLREEKSKLRRELQDRLTSRLLVESQETVSFTSQLHEQIQTAMEEIHREASLLVVGVAVILGILISAISFFISRGLVRSIDKLHKGTEIIGSGNLEFKVGLDVKDEIGQLSKAFDQMTEKLKTVMATRDELEKEVIERKHAEERISHLNTVLRAIRDVNQLIVKEKDRIHLIQEACKILIGTEAYHGTWIALLDESENFEAVAEAGLENKGSQLLRRLKNGDVPLCVGKALNGSEGPVLEILSHACEECPLANNHARKRSMLIRLEHEDRLFGLLTVFFSSEIPTDQEEQSLLSEVAGDIAYALHGIEVKKEHKQAEEDLRKERDRAQMYLDIAGVMFVALDANEKVTLINKKGCEILGYDEEEILGKYWFDHFLTPGHRKEVKGVFKQLMSGAMEPVEYFENPILTKDGKQRYIAWHNTLLRNEKKDIIGTFSSGEDITDRKEAEKERKKLEAHLQQAQKMESIGTLAGGIAHDFNNILFPIVGYAEMMLDDTPQDSPLRNGMFEILDGAKRARDLVKQILAFSRQADQELKPLKIQLVIKEALGLIRSSLPSTIEIIQDLSNDCGLVMADPTQIHQVAMNLITNAYHAMQETGGKLEVTLKEVELGADYLKDQTMSPGPYTCIAVADTGVGMEKVVLDRIFDPYFTTKAKDKGTGLGLSVVHGIVKSYNGDIRVYSEPGKGTVFHVYLPVIRTRVEAHEIEADAPVQKGNESILLVDDEESIVHMEKQMLERLGYHVTARTGSFDALETFRLAPDMFDLVITDMTMPNMTGIQLSQELLEIKPDIPIIICTGFSEQINADNAKVLGIRGFIMKPVIMSALGKKIRALLDE